MNIDKLIYKIGQCIDYQSLYALEEDFNGHGLTIQTTSNNRIILSKLVEGGAITDNVIDDYIFVGGLANATQEISERAAMKIGDFVRSNAGTASELKVGGENAPRVWRNGLKMYESSIVLMNEDVAYMADVICEDEIEV